MSRSLMFSLFLIGLLFFGGCGKSKDKPVAPPKETVSEKSLGESSSEVIVETSTEALDSDANESDEEMSVVEKAELATKDKIQEDLPKINPSNYPNFKFVQEDGQTILEQYTGFDEKVIIPKGVTKIGGGAFYERTSLTSVVIPEGVTEIGGSAFFCCPSLKSVVIPESVTKIGKNAFSVCGFTSVVIPKGVAEIEEGAFRECESLKSVVIPKSVTKIGDTAFCGCSSLTSVEIPEGVTEIEWDAFSGCESLTTVTIPDSLKKIGGGAFANCTALKEWNISSEHPYFKTDGICLLTKDGKKLVVCPGSVTEYQLPKGVTEIESCAFAGCSSLTSVVIPEGVTKIGYRAFAYCESLTSVVIPKSVTEIEAQAFRFCESLTSVVIPNGVTEIGDMTFSECPELTIHAPKGSKAAEYAEKERIRFEAE